MQNLYSYYTQVAFFSLIILNHIFEIYLSKRQEITLHKNLSLVPSEFSNYLDLESHQKSIRYAIEKLKLGQFKLITEAVILLYWFPFKGAENLYLSLPLNGIQKEVLFLISFLLIQYFLSLPWRIYITFKIENKFNFNRTSPMLFFIDQIKALVISAIITTPLIYGLILMFNHSGKWWWFFCFSFVTSFQFFLIWIYPTIIAPWFNKFSLLSSIELKSGIEKLVQNAGLNAKEIYIMDASKRSAHGNAYFTGLGKNKRVVFYDTLIQQLNNNEIFSILAHELGHMKFRHIQKSLFQSLIFLLVGFWIMKWVSSEIWFYHGHFLRSISPATLFLIFLEAAPIYAFWFQPLNSWISRRREFEADEYSAQETNGKELISGLLKLYKHNASPVVSDKLYSLFYFSHPPALERIRRLQSIIK